MPYNVIIVGGGTAGLLAASRLTEDPATRVLVVDAGVDRRGDPVIDTPGMIMKLWGDKTYDWDYYTEPQKHLHGRQIPQPRGRVLGGCSAINAAAMVYPTPRNFESWTRLGNRGWSHADVAPFYRQLESFSPPSSATNALLSVDSRFDATLHGTSGPLRTSFPDAYGSFNAAWLHAFDSAGFADRSDPILGRHQGAFTPANTVDAATCRRSYAASAFLTPEVEARPNLEILTETAVNRVLFARGDDGLLTATGVEVTKDGSVREIHAQDIVLAAGTFQSPVVLENSGIGSPDVLGRHGIDVLIDLPGVGENLQDHCFTSVSFEVADGQLSADAARDPAVVNALLRQYAESRSGPLSGVALSLAFTPSVDWRGIMGSSDVEAMIGSRSNGKSASSGKKSPLSAGLRKQHAELYDLLRATGESCLFYGLMASQMNVQPAGRTSMPEAYGPQHANDFITVMVGLNHPFSRGSVHTRGPGSVEPAIDPNYLSHPLDLEILARGTQFIERIVDQPAFKPLLKQNGAVLPSYASSLEDLGTARRVVEDRLWTLYHPTSTCAMMPRESGGVVSDRLVVHGTKNLRVIDASTFPMIPMGNVQTTVYAVADRACEMMREE